MIWILLSFVRPLDEIRAAIEAKGARWRAAETPISKMYEETGEVPLGLIPSLPEKASPVPLSPVPLPDSFSWMDYMTPVKNQGNCGSCWAFGAVGAFEAVINIAAGVPDPELDLSEQNLVSCATSSGCNGYSISGAMDFLQTDGTCSEECFPYVALDASNGAPCSDSCDTRRFTTRKVSSYGWVGLNPTLDEVKTAIYNYGPLEVGMDVYTDFFYYSGGVYEHTWGDYEGGHAIVMLGWNDNDSCWICKNSWGTGWGEKGYFRIKYGECSIEQSCYWMTPAPTEYPLLYVVKAEVEDMGDGDGVLNPGEQGKINLILRNSPAWGSISSLQGTLTTEAPIDILDNSGAWPDMAPGDTCSMTDSFAVFIPDTATPGEYTFVASVIGLTANFNYWWDDLEFPIRIGWQQAGWPVGDEKVMGSPAVVEENGEKFVIYGDFNGYVHKRNAYGEEDSLFPVYVGGSIRSHVAVSDVDLDNMLEIAVCVTAVPGYVTLLDFYGNILWSDTLPTTITTGPVIADLNGDGKKEIIAIDYDGTIWVFDCNGDTVSPFPMTSPDSNNVSAPPAVGDVDRDGTPEIVFGTSGGNLYAMKPDGSVLSGFPVSTGTAINGSPSLLDTIIAFGCDDYSLYVVSRHGSIISSFATDGMVRGSPAFVDLDKDGMGEIVFSSYDGNVYAINIDGTLLSGWPVSIGTAPVSPVAGYLGYEDRIFVLNSSGVLYYLASNGTIKSPAPYSTTSSPTAPQVVDLDGDGDIEVVYGTSSGVWAVDIKVSGSTTTHWSMDRANPERTGYIATALGTWRKAPEISISSVISGELMLNYSSFNGEKVELILYNVLGRKVKSLYSGTLEGTGKKAFDLKLTPGIYFLRVKGEGMEKIFKFAYVR